MISTSCRYPAKIGGRSHSWLLHFANTKCACRPTGGGLPTVPTNPAASKCTCSHFQRAGRNTRSPMPAPRSRNGNLVFRSEQHTSELQSHLNLVCRRLLDKKKE